MPTPERGNLTEKDSLKNFKRALDSIFLVGDNLTIRDVTILLDIAEHDGTTLEDIKNRTDVRDTDLATSLLALSLKHRPKNRLVERQPAYSTGRPDVARITTNARMLLKELRSTLEPQVTTAPTSELNWTSSKPTTPGWYWYKVINSRARVVEVVESDCTHRLAVAQTGAFVDDLESEKYQWAGPLELPPYEDI